MKKEIKLLEEQTLKDGSTIVNIELNNLQSKDVYDAAILDNTLTVKDLEYQFKGLKTRSFKKLVIGAFVLQACKTFLEKEELRGNND